MFSRSTKGFYTPVSSKNPTTIAYITDSEGSTDFFKAVSSSNIVNYHPKKGLSFYNSIKNPHFIYGGDITDRGNNDLRITKLLVDFKTRYPENVSLLVGNREITKGRFKIELAPQLIRERILNSQVPRWLLEQPTLPLDYAQKAMSSDYFHGRSNEQRSVKNYLESLSTSQCQLIYLHWMLEKTMGCPHSFRYRREELKIIKQTDTITDEEVLHSFIYESSPKGITGKYLQLAQIGVIVSNTGVLAVHGGLQPNNLGRIPGMKPDEEPIANAQLWIDKLNQWYNNQIQSWITFEPTKLTIPACTALDECALPIPNKPKSVITADMLTPKREFTDIPTEVLDYLKKNHIQLVLTGHQPCGDHPVLLRGPSTFFINGDTGYASSNSKNPDDTRGFAHHLLSITADDIKTKIYIDATLSDKTEVKTELAISVDKVEGDEFIGKIAADHKLVQCRLPNGNYRLIQQKGIKCNYFVVSENELKEMIALDYTSSMNNLNRS